MILSPIVVERKGEQLDMFDELRAQGFVRLRVNGKVCEMDNLPKLAKNQKHTIEIVVDRLKVAADIKQRLAESFETALRHADGRALAVEMDTGKEHVFSAKFACRFATTHYKSWSRVCFRSTARWVLARNATAWA